MEFDLKCRDLNKKLSTLLQQSGLPLTMIIYILNDFSNSLQIQLNNYLQQATEQQKNDKIQDIGQ